MTENKRFYMDKSGDLYDRENNIVMVDFGYSYDGVGCKRIIDLLNELNNEKEQLKKIIDEDNVLLKAFLSVYCNRKWKNFCKNYGIDLKKMEEIE